MTTASKKCLIDRATGLVKAVANGEVQIVPVVEDDMEPILRMADVVFGCFLDCGEFDYFAWIAHRQTVVTFDEEPEPIERVSEDEYRKFANTVERVCGWMGRSL